MVASLLLLTAGQHPGRGGVSTLAEILIVIAAVVIAVGSVAVGVRLLTGFARRDRDRAARPTVPARRAEPGDGEGTGGERSSG